MKVRVSRRATRELERAVKWWLETYDVPPPLLKELREVIAVLRALPEHGVPIRTVRGRVVRRVLLRESQYHVYYRVAEGEAVEIMSVWSTARGRTPKLGQG